MYGSSFIEISVSAMMRAIGVVDACSTDLIARNGDVPQPEHIIFCTLFFDQLQTTVYPRRTAYRSV